MVGSRSPLGLGCRRTRPRLGCEAPKRNGVAVEPISLAVLGAAALTEGIKFLYGQAGEILKRRRERREAIDANEEPPPSTLEAKSSDLLDNPIALLTIDDEEVDRVTESMNELRKELFDFVDGVKSVDPSDEILLRRADALRRALESAVGQRITFVGENREPSGQPVVRGSVDVRELHSAATGVEAGDVMGGTIEGEVRVDSVGKDAPVTGARVGNVGQ